MTSATELLAGLLDLGDAPALSSEEMSGPHEALLRDWQRLGFLAAEPGANPVPGCPHCRRGIPYLIGGRVLCHRCRSRVDPAALHLWAFDRAAFFRWLATALRLRGEPRPVGAVLWQLGTGEVEGEPCEVFYRRPGTFTSIEQNRLLAYRSALCLFGRSTPEPDGFRGERLTVTELLTDARGLTARPLAAVFHARDEVRFDAQTGALRAGRRLLGEVPLGSKECAFLERLAAEADRYVSYADLKRAVLRRTGSTDTTEEATFCQKLKSRIKGRFIPGIDALIMTTNKGDGYRLRGRSDGPAAGGGMAMNPAAG